MHITLTNRNINTTHSDQALKAGRGADKDPVGMYVLLISMERYKLESLCGAFGERASDKLKYKSASQVLQEELDTLQFICFEAGITLGQSVTFNQGGLVYCGWAVGAWDLAKVVDNIALDCFYEPSSQLPALGMCREQQKLEALYKAIGDAPSLSIQGSPNLEPALSI